MTRTRRRFAVWRLDRLAALMDAWPSDDPARPELREKTGTLARRARSWLAERGRA